MIAGVVITYILGREFMGEGLQLMITASERVLARLAVAIANVALLDVGKWVAKTAKL